MESKIFLLMLSVYCGTTTGNLARENFNTDTRIVNGTNANTETTKHQVSIRLDGYDVPFGRAHICGGSLINYRTVLTAAHCTHDDQRYFNARDIFVVMGTLLKNQTTSNTITRRLKSIVRHKNYSTNTIANDIAVLILSENVPENHLTIKPISLTDGKFATNTLCQITGWGTTSYIGSSSNHLLTANVTILDIARCNSSNSYNGQILSGMFCAGFWEGHVDSCQGDSGGPLVCQNMLAGIVSWGYECARPGFPGIYTDIHYYSKWIAENSVNHIISINIFVYFLVTIILQIF